MVADRRAGWRRTGGWGVDRGEGMREQRRQGLYVGGMRKVVREVVGSRLVEFGVTRWQILVNTSKAIRPSCNLETRMRF
jgi:hypothetical protein